MLLEVLFKDPMTGFALILAILLALTIHEYCHGWVAGMLGDDTAEEMGRLTLNPIPHIDILGFAMLLLAGFGWGKPVPINPYNFKNVKRDSGFVAAAGPASNLIFSIIVLIFRLIFVKFGVAQGSMVYLFFDYLIYINLILMLFNLIPLPPLDGSKILFSLLPSKYRHIQATLEHNGPQILMGLVLISIILPVSIFSFIGTGALIIQNFMFSLVS